MIKKKLLIVGLLPLLMMGCSSQSVVSSAKSYSSWLNNEKNGCKVTKEVNGMVLEIKYLPPSFLALKDLESAQETGASYDSLLNAYQYSTTFLITFKPKDEENGQDVMFKDVTNYKEYIERSMTLNFDLESKINLKTNAGEYKPVLSSLENTYGLSKARNIYMVFTAKDKKNELIDADYFDLTYSDDIYSLGILHFIFDYKTIKKHLPIVDIKHS